MGRAFMEGRPVQVEDVLVDPDYDARTLEVLQRVAGYRTFLGIPILQNGVPIGVIGCGRRKVSSFTAKQIELVKVFADQAVIAIENTRLFEAEQARTRELQEALEYQTATSEVLGVIGRSPNDAEPVFEAVGQSAARLCGADFMAVVVYDGSLMHVASRIAGDRAPERFDAMYPRPPDRTQIGGARVKRAPRCDWLGQAQSLERS
jgi:two-component system, NtrC family, sensor kinase